MSYATVDGNHALERWLLAGEGKEAAEESIRTEAITERETRSFIENGLTVINYLTEVSYV
jgi:hypothetical protein